MIDENHFTKYFRYNIWSHQPKNKERVDDVVLIPNYVNVSGLTGSKLGWVCFQYFWAHKVRWNVKKIYNYDNNFHGSTKFLIVWKIMEYSTRNNIYFSGSKVYFIYLVVPIDFTNHQNTAYAQSCLRLHLHIKDQNPHQR